MATSASPPPATAGARPRVSPGFGARLGIGLGLALLVVYALLAGLQARQAASLEHYALKTDFLTTLTGAQIVLDGTPGLVYDRATQERTQTALRALGGYPPGRLLPFIHPPFELLLIVPLRVVGLPPGATFLGWTLLSLLAVGGALAALRWGWPIHGAAGGAATLLALTFYPLFIGLLLGQTVAVMLLGWAAGSAALHRGYPAWAGAAFALGLLKPQALPLIVLALLITRRWRTLATLGAVSLGAGVGALLLLGPTWPTHYLQLALSVGGYPPDPTLDPAGMQNVRGLLVRLLGDTALVNTLATGALLIAAAGVAIVWLRAARRDGAAPGTSGWDGRWAATLLVSLPASSYLLVHDLALALVPGWIIAAHAPARRDTRLVAWLGLGWALGFIAAPYQATPLPLIVLWMLITVGWLVWEEFRTTSSRWAPAATGMEERNQ